MTTSCSKRRTLFVDTETYSSVDLTSSGVYKYAEASDFEILLLPYAWDDEPVRVLDMFDPHDREELPDIIAGLLDPDTVKVAHNSSFERNVYRAAFGHYMPPEEWVDTMILAAYNGLPLSLEGAGEVLGIEQQKLKEGKALINYFCKPCKPTIANGGRTRNLPHHNPEKWEKFKQYAAIDVEAERQIYRRLQHYPVTPFERQVWALDARINERGVLVDLDLAEAAVEVDNAFKAEHVAEMRRLTGLDNPNSVAQLKEWLTAVGVSCETLNKASVQELKAAVADPTILRVLELRQMLGKTSIKKYQAMTDAVSADDRIRGITQYYGAARTGRWAGRRVQLQNLTKNESDPTSKKYLGQPEQVREIVRTRDLELLELCYSNVPDVLSQLVRTALIAKPGHTFLVSDYAAIEARVIAYLAGEQWRLDVFAKGGDIYCSSASQMFKVPVEKHGVNGHLRAKGKVAELACGYGGGVHALMAFGADKMGLTEDEMQSIVNQWRAASPKITRFWRDTERAAQNALQNPGRTYGLPCGVKYRRDRDALRCLLPSGRVLTYWDARLENGAIVFMGLATSKGRTTKKWCKIDTWGGKLVENIVQAYARDCLAVAMVRLERAGWDIVFHVHDEVVVEAPDGSRWEDVAEVMGQPIPWAPGLLLRGDGYATRFYLKD
jgi:DNA polymerase